MANLNKVFLMGNLTRDPELRFTPGGAPVCQFGMAINRKWTTREGEQRDETCFVEVAMWGRRGEVISEYLSKGQPIFVEGRLKFDTWESPNGRRSKLSVVAENFEFIGAPSGGARAPKEPTGRAQQPREQKPPSGPEGLGPQQETTQEGFDVSDDEIPF